MIQKLATIEFLAAAEEGVVVDVRSPGEYAAGHIPGANNIPLFTDAERAEVGTCYKQTGRQDALLLGLEIVGPKMRSLAETAHQLVEARAESEPQILLHCWRGGMRSSSVGWLLEQTGMSPSVLEGGYKAFRRTAHAAFAAPRNLAVLSGMTGSGKTRMLYQLSAAGEQVLDLEGLAHHRGSSYGAIGLPPQPTCEQFENLVYTRLRDSDPCRPLWIEDESPSIGKVRIPDTLWSIMRKSPAFFLNADRKARALNLAEEYGALNREALEDATRRLERKLGGLRLREILSDLERGDMFQVAYRLLAYYDKAYQHAATRKPREHVHQVDGDISVGDLIRCSRQECEV